jgi:4-amino-4-deoxy-L-arabinose transferase-like glycosyltransferase
VRPLREFRARLGLIALAAFALRAVWALAIAPDELKHRGDARFFHLAANLLADGHGYIAPLPFLANGTALASSEHPPGWSGLLAIFSLAGADSYIAHELVGCAVGAGTVVCAALLGRRLGGPRAGLIAAAIAAVYPVYVALDGSLMSEPPYALGVAVCMVLAFGVADVPSLRRAALLGVAIGATVLVRGEALGLLVVLAVPAVLAARARRVARLAIVWAVALVVMAPWCVRNSTTFDHPMLVSSEDGPVIAGANCGPTYHGRDSGYWHSACVGLRAERNPAVRSDELRRQGLDYARDHAGRLPAVEGVRLLRTFGLWQPARHVYFAEGRAMPGRPVAVACSWAVLALAIAGAALLRRRRVALGVLLAPVALAVVTTLLAFGYSRFRYAADVALIVLAAYALECAIRARAGGGSPAAAPAAAPPRRAR